jgi:hypothetical protein
LIFIGRKQSVPAPKRDGATVVAEALAAGVPGEGGAIEESVRSHDVHKQTLPKNINRPNCTEYRTRSNNATAVVVLMWLVT